MSGYNHKTNCNCWMCNNSGRTYEEFFGRESAQKMNQKRSTSHTGKRHYYKNWTEGKTKETDEKMRLANEKSSESRLKISKERLTEIGRLGAASAKNVRVSLPELALQNELRNRRIPFLAQYLIHTENITTRVDIFLLESRTCLYFDGRYWHNKPEVFERALTQNKELPKLGYRVLRIDEVVRWKIKKHLMVTVDKILSNDIVRTSEESGELDRNALTVIQVT